MKRIASTVRTGWTEMSSRNENLLDELTVRMADERAAYVGRDRSPAAREYRKRQDSLLTTIRAIGKTGDINLIFSAERDVLQNEIRHYGNSSGMRGSLKTALQEIDHRSEEHTSELQSLMRISYAVFCLKNKNTNQK